MKNTLFPFSILLLLISCSARKAPSAASVEFLPGKKIAELTGEKLDEVSGLATSINNPGLLWAHNDGKNKPEIFLIDQELNIRHTYVLHGVKNRDWEDIAVGPGPDSIKNYVYVAEIGDNDGVYPVKYIYRFEEPLPDSMETESTISNFDIISFRLPGTPKDTETLLLDPGTKDLYIISKREQPVHVYQLAYPYSTDGTLTARQVGSLPITQTVSGNVSADGQEILIKNYNHIYYWKNISNKTIPELLKEKPQEIPYEIEPQGESITWARDKSGFYTISEKSKGKKSFLYFYQRNQ